MRDPAEVLGKDPEANELECSCASSDECPYHLRIWATKMLVAEVLQLRKETGRTVHGELVAVRAAPPANPTEPMDSLDALDWYTHTTTPTEGWKDHARAVVSELRQLRASVSARDAGPWSHESGKVERSPFPVEPVIGPDGNIRAFSVMPPVPTGREEELVGHPELTRQAGGGNGYPSVSEQVAEIGGHKFSTLYICDLRNKALVLRPPYMALLVDGTPVGFFGDYALARQYALHPLCQQLLAGLRSAILGMKGPADAAALQAAIKLATDFLVHAEKVGDEKPPRDRIVVVQDLPTPPGERP